MHDHAHILLLRYIATNMPEKIFEECQCNVLIVQGKIGRESAGVMGKPSM